MQRWMFANAAAAVSVAAVCGVTHKIVSARDPGPSTTSNFGSADHCLVTAQQIGAAIGLAVLTTVATIAAARHGSSTKNAGRRRPRRPAGHHRPPPGAAMKPVQ